MVPAYLAQSKRIHAHRQISAFWLPMIRETVTEGLLRATYNVSSVQDPEAPLSALASGAKPDVVVTDLMMAGMGGQALVETLRREAPLTSVIVLTGKLEGEGEGEDAEALTDGAFGVLRKPADTEDILAMVWEACLSGPRKIP